MIFLDKCVWFWNSMHFPYSNSIGLLFRMKTNALSKTKTLKAQPCAIVHANWCENINLMRFIFERSFWSSFGVIKYKHYHGPCIENIEKNLTESYHWIPNAGNQPTISDIDNIFLWNRIIDWCVLKVVLAKILLEKNRELSWI